MASSSTSLALFSIFILYYLPSLPAAEPKHAAPRCTGGPVRATIPILTFLEELQTEAIKTFGPSNFDPKLYIDLPLKHDLSATEEAFRRLRRTPGSGEISEQELEAFLSNYTEAAGSDLLPHLPADFVPEPEGFLPNVARAEVREWALEVHSRWRNLSRKVSPDVAEHPDRHTLLPLPELVVVPGSRFEEVYYWDSYWTIRGLLASKMHDTAKSLVRSLISLVHTYGFVLNGARAYYTNRSEPPLLSSMVREIYERTGDMEFLKTCLPALLKEYEFWNSGYHKVTIRDAYGHCHSLNRYYAMWNKPRPESFIDDEATTTKVTDATEKMSVYREISSTAESGWDFSSRWMRNSSDLATLSTTSILPVDLNSYILKMELDIAFLAKAIGDSSTSENFSLASKNRHAAIKSIFWSPKNEQWLDYWLADENGCKGVHQWEAQNQNDKAFASNFIPLWIESFHPDSYIRRGKVERVAQSLKKSGLLRGFGIATSLTNSGQQWDFPNGWPPLQHMIVEGLAKSGSKEAISLAEDIFTRWITTNYATFKKTGFMIEKYNVELCGNVGGGGEYQVQTGFGWTNGVALAFLEEFGWASDKDISCESLP